MQPNSIFELNPVSESLCVWLRKDQTGHKKENEIGNRYVGIYMQRGVNVGSNKYVGI